MTSKLKETINKSLKDNSIFLLCFLIGFSINVSQVILGVNFSLSDIFLMILIVHLQINRKMVFSRKMLLVFFIIISLRLIATLFLNSWIIMPISLRSILIPFQKLIICILYFLVFYTLGKLSNKVKVVFFSGFEIGTLIIGFLSIVVFYVGPSFIKDIILFGGLRLRGLVNDPNLFGYLQLSGFCIWFYNRFSNKILNVFAFTVYFVSILLTGSKTALLTLVIIFFLTLLYSNFINIEVSKRKLKKLFVVIAISSIVLLFYNALIGLVADLISNTPQLNRSMSVFLDFGNALNVEGSGRGQAWNHAFQIISNTNLLGIGFVDYSAVAKVLFGSSLIAHNTYLQIFVEWGVFPGISVFFIIFMRYLYILIKKDYILSLLISAFFIVSFSVSLQNSRLAWILFAFLFLKTSTISINKFNKTKESK